MVSFTICINDFGVPVVIGGPYSVLSTDIYKLIIGLQDFNRSAVVSLLLLCPALVAFAVDFFIRRKQQSQLGARSTPYQPKPARGFDIGDARVLRNRLHAAVGGGRYFGVRFVREVLAVSDEPRLAALQDGTDRRGDFRCVQEQPENGRVRGDRRHHHRVRRRVSGREDARAALVTRFINLCAILPMGVPGLVLGISYIFLFNSPATL
jgi:ABC-type Fe3+ transport system, permease component